jgi:hypothetical protein
MVKVAWTVKLTTRFHQVSMLRMTGAITPLPHLSSWPAQSQLCLWTTAHTRQYKLSLCRCMFFLGNSATSEFYMLTFRNTLSVPSS